MEVLIKNISHVRADKAQLGRQSTARAPSVPRPPLIMRATCPAYCTQAFLSKFSLYTGAGETKELNIDSLQIVSCTILAIYECVSRWRIHILQCVF